MPVEHKVVLGGERFLPFARSRIAALRRVGLAYANQNFEVDGCSIKVSITPGESFIRIIEQPQGGYQFFTTGPVPERATFAGIEFLLDKGHMVGISADGKPKIRGSTLEKSSDDKWRFSDDPLDVAKFSQKRNIWQIQGIPEHSFHTARDGKMRPHPFLVDSWSSSDQLFEMGARGSLLASRSSIDVAYDLAPSQFAAQGSRNSRSGAAPDADWYKRAALRTVESELFGSRRFIILTDISNVFHVYPVGVTEDVDATLDEKLQDRYIQQSIKTNVPKRVTKSKPAPLPAWCRKPDVVSRDFYVVGDERNFTELVRRVPQYRWAFSPDGKKACSIVFEDLPAGVMTASNGSEVPLVRRVVQGGGAVDIPLQETLPGLVELDIKITITGPKPEDFSFELALTTERQGSLSGNYILAADYAWEVEDFTGLDAEQRIDPKRTPVYFAKPGDLIVMYAQAWHTSDDRTAHSIDGRPSIKRLGHFKGLALVRNETAGKVLRTFLLHDTSQPYELRADNPAYTEYDDDFRRHAETQHQAGALIVAVDLRVLAFVVQQRYVKTWVLNVENRHQKPVHASTQRVKTYMFNELVDEVIMDQANGPKDAPLYASPLVFETELQAKLVEMHAATDTRGMFLFLANDRGVYSNTRSSGYLTLGDLFFITNATQSRLSAYGRDNPRFAFLPAGIQTGAIFHGHWLATRVQLDHRNYFSVHPNGSWSVTTTPIFHYAGVTVANIDGSDAALQDLPPEVYEFNPLLIRQTILDIVHLQGVDKKRKPKLYVTSHVEALALALGKEVTTTAVDGVETTKPSKTKAQLLAPYLCTFSLVKDEYIIPHPTTPNTDYVARNVFLKAVTPAGAVLWFFLAQRGGTFTVTQPLPTVDMRLPFNLSYVEPPVIDYGTPPTISDTTGQRTVYPITYKSPGVQGNFFQNAAYFGGSSLFH